MQIGASKIFFWKKFKKGIKNAKFHVDFKSDEKWKPKNYGE